MTEEERLKEIFIEHLDVKEEEITKETPLESLTIDSLELLEVLVAIEDEFDITLDDDEIQRMETVGEMLDLIIERIRE